MKQLKVLGIIVVIANVVVLAFLMMRQPSNVQPNGMADLVAPLVSDNTMEAAQYDLSDRGQKLNVILISLDALRYDHTGLGGSELGLTPNLDQFAEEAVVFHDAVSAAPWTLPSHMSVWTARWPTVHGVTNKLKLLSHDQMVDATLSPGIETFPDVLIREGWIAGGFSGGAGVQSMYGFGRGFDTYLDDRYFGGLDYSIPAALDWLRKHQDERFFMFLHGYDTHGQYALAEGGMSSIEYDGTLDGGKEEQAKLREQGLTKFSNPGEQPLLTEELSEGDADFLEEVYNRKVRDADQRLGGFIAQLKAMGLMENSVIVLMSDHGDEFMEHGGVDHGFTLYQEQLHVVMMMRFPGYTSRHDVREPVRTIDIFPTVFDVMGIPAPKGVDGQSMRPIMQGQADDRAIFAESDYRLFVHLRMVRQGKYKLILDLKDGSRELYDLEADPLEQNDISSSEPRRTYEMEQDLRGWLGDMGSNPQDYLGIEQRPITLF